MSCYTSLRFVDCTRFLMATERGSALASFCLTVTITILLLIAPDVMAASKRRPDCASVTPARTQEICQAMAASFTWQWSGHAIIAPGYKPDLQTIGKAYCRAKITQADAPALEKLRQSMDWRLQSAAEQLQKILSAQEGTSQEPENSVFNPKSPHYVLRGGCG